MINWNIYEISSSTQTLHGVKFRGRIRKFAISQNINVLSENATDTDNVVRFALEASQSPEPFIEFINAIMPDCQVKLVATQVTNPVLSKLKVNQAERYHI